MSIKEDLKLYPVYIFRNKKLTRIENPTGWSPLYQMHHFVRKSIRKTNLQFYKRIEHLQKLILMPSQMNYDLEIMGEVRFFAKYGVNKNDLVFNRKKWREGYYDTGEKSA